MNERALRQALKLLGYTNQSLADELSAARSDGQRTSPATVSRWVSGAAAADPGVVLYLKERLVNLYLEHYRPRLPQPKLIAIGGGKGGSGASTCCLALATVAAQCGYRTAVALLSQACNIDFASQHPARNITVFAPGAEFNVAKFDFVFLDAPKGLYQMEQTLPELLPRLDLFAVPADLACLFTIEPTIDTLQLLQTQPDCPPLALLPVSRGLDLPGILRMAERIEPWRQLILPEGVVYAGEPLSFGEGQWRFVSDDAVNAWYKVLEGICERLGVSLYEAPHSRAEVRQMAMQELVAALAE